MCGSLTISHTSMHMITTDLLVAPLNFCHMLGSNTALHKDLLYLATGDIESLEKNLFHDVIGH